MKLTSKPSPHIHDSDRLWFIDGKAYDLSEFISKHPGGPAALRLGQGTNCSELFRCYHFKKNPPQKLFERYEVEVDRNDPLIIERLGSSGFTFEEDGFYKTIQRRSRAYFKETGKSHRATLFEQMLALTMILGAIALIYPAYIKGSLLAAFALGFVRALASVSPGHSMSHFSVFPGRFNTLAFHLTSPFMVSTWAIWTSTHVRSHHIDTLTLEDLQDNYPLKRVQRESAFRPWHRHQHQYIWVVYLLSLPLWTAQDLLVSIQGLWTGTNPWRVSRRQLLGNVVALSCNLFFTVVLPFLFLPFLQALMVCLVANAVASLMVVLQIVVNHEVPETLGVTSPANRGDWGAHQVLTSHNYGVDSWLALHLSGGLNMQIEHHLFPSVHYTHYPALARIVREACVEYGLPYNTSPSIFGAVKKHHDLLAMNSVP